MKYLFFLPFGATNYRFIGSIYDKDADAYDLTSIRSGTFMVADSDNNRLNVDDVDKTFYLPNGETIVVRSFPEYEIVD